MVRLFQLSLIVGAVLVSSGCSYIYGEDGLIKDNTYAYLEAKQTKDIVIPESLKQEERADYTPIPAIGTKAAQSEIGKEVKIRAPVQILAVLDNVRVNKQAPHPTVYILEDEEFLWNAIVDLFNTSEVNLEINDVENRILQTDWIATDERGVWMGMAGQEDVDEFRSKFKVSFDAGVLKGEKQVQVERVMAEKLNEETENWESVPSFWQDSAEMLNMVISHYDSVATARDKEIRARNLAGFSVRLARDEDDNAALVTDAKLEHVWEKLPKVLDEADFDVGDRDRRLMTYFVQYELKEPGFFASLFESEEETLPLESGDYQVTLRQLGERTAIVFRDGQGTPLNSATMTKLFPTLSKLFGTKR